VGSLNKGFGKFVKNFTRQNSRKLSNRCNACV